jgi:hypothetical protein
VCRGLFARANAEGQASDDLIAVIHAIGNSATAAEQS